MLDPKSHVAEFDDTFSSSITVNFDEQSKRILSHKTTLSLSFSETEEVIGVAEFDVGLYITSLQNASFEAKFELGDPHN